MVRYILQFNLEELTNGFRVDRYHFKCLQLDSREAEDIRK